MEREDLIKQTLLDHPEGLTVKELADLCKVSTVTIAKDLDTLIALDKIYMREVGKAKLHYHFKHIKKFTKLSISQSQK